MLALALIRRRKGRFHKKRRISSSVSGCRESGKTVSESRVAEFGSSDGPSRPASSSCCCNWSAVASSRTLNRSCGSKAHQVFVRFMEASVTLRRPPARPSATRIANIGLTKAMTLLARNEVFCETASQNETIAADVEFSENRDADVFRCQKTAGAEISPSASLSARASDRARTSRGLTPL
jgi:hypothetical protein